MATGSAHHRLEERIDLLGRSWSRAFYCLLLQKFYGFYGMVEPQVLGFPDWHKHGLRIEKRCKLGLLRRDLMSLGLSVEEVDVLPLCCEVPALPGFAEALGCAYVLEGSTLGGQIITRHLRRELGPEVEGSCAFFVSYGSDVGPMWQEFVHFLNSCPLSPVEEEALLQSACATFSSLEEWLSDIV